MDPEPHDEMRGYRGSGQLEGLAALVTGGDSGIGRAVSVAFAKEGLSSRPEASYVTGESSVVDGGLLLMAAVRNLG